MDGESENTVQNYLSGAKQKVVAIIDVDDDGDFDITDILILAGIGFVGWYGYTKLFKAMRG